MKKSLIVILALSLVLVFATAAFALDKDKDSIVVRSNFRNVVWVTLTKNSDMAPIERQDVKRGWKAWNNIAELQTDAATQYMIALDVKCLAAPDNYKIVDVSGGGGKVQNFTNNSTFMGGPFDTQEKQFDHRLVARTRKKASSRILASVVMDTQSLPYKLLPGFDGYYNGQTWNYAAIGLPTSPSGEDEFKNAGWVNGNGPLADPAQGWLGVDGNCPIVAAGPSTNSYAPGDKFFLDLGLQMIEGDNIASGRYRVKITSVVMEIVPGASNSCADILAVIQ